MELLKLLFGCMVLFLAVWLVLNKKPAVWQAVTDRIEALSDGKIMCGLFLLVLLTQGGGIFYRKLPFVADEIYSISGAAFFAGYDWSNYMSLHKFYNFGYTMLLAPIYKIFTNPVVIYRAMLFVNVLFFGAMVLLIYHIARKYLKTNRMNSIVITLVCSCNSIVLFFKGFIYNELPLALITWLTIYLLLELSQSTGRKRVLLSAILGMVTAYAYLVHSRCLILFVSLGLLVLLYLLIYKKWLVQPVSFGAVFGIFFYLEKILLNYVQTNLYLKDGTVVMPNSVEHMATGTWQYATLTSLEGIKRLILQFFSLAGTVSIETGGLFTVISAVFLYYLCKNFKKIKGGEECEKTFILAIFSFVSLWGMVACISLFGASNGKIRFLLYSRYFAPFLGPFLLMGLAFLKNNRSLRFKWITIWSFVLNAMIIFTFVFYSYPALKGNSMKENASLYLFLPFARYSKQTRFSKNVIFIALSLLIIFTIVLLFLYRRRQFTAFCAVVIMFSAVLTWRVEKLQCEPAAERRYNSCNATYELLEDNEEFDELDVYCLGSETYRKAVLVSCYDKEIIYDLESVQANENAVLLSSEVEKLLFYQPEYIYQLDNNEWIGGWNAEINTYLKGQYERYQE